MMVVMVGFERWWVVNGGEMSKVLTGMTIWVTKLKIKDGAIMNINTLQNKKRTEIFHNKAVKNNTTKTSGHNLSEKN